MKFKLPPHIPDELGKAGAKLIESGIGGKHPFVRFEIAGLTRKFFFSGTASDHRSTVNNRHELRRFIRRTIEEAKQVATVAT